jgi:hypothetical protein
MVFPKRQEVVVVAFLLTLSNDTTLLPLSFLNNGNLVSRNVVDYDGPARADETVGSMRIYVFRADWSLVNQVTAARLGRRFKDIDILHGNYAALYPLSAADMRYCWAYGAAIGLFRNFKAQKQSLPDPWESLYRLKGSRRDGWITAVLFNGTVRTKPELLRKLKKRGVFRILRHPSRLV